MATVLRTDGTSVFVTPKHGKTFWYDEVYALLGDGVDTIRAMSIGGGEKLVVDEDAPRKANAERNDKASNLAGFPLYGNVLLCKAKEFRS